MRTLAFSKVYRRSLLHIVGLALMSLGLGVICGCTTTNDPADLSSTEWEAKTLIQDGKSAELAEQKSQLSLSRNGTFRWTKGAGTKRRSVEGSYELSAGNQVVLNLKDEIEGSKTHVAELTLSKDKDGKPVKLVYKDSQGTVEFEPKK